MMLCLEVLKRFYPVTVTVAMVIVFDLAASSALPRSGESSYPPKAKLRTGSAR